jgi:hypothetical protein
MNGINIPLKSTGSGLLAANGFCKPTPARIRTEGKEFDAGMSFSFSIAENHGKVSGRGHRRHRKINTVELGYNVIKGT